MAGAWIHGSALDSCFLLIGGIGWGKSHELVVWARSAMFLLSGPAVAAREALLLRMQVEILTNVEPPPLRWNRYESSQLATTPRRAFPKRAGPFRL